MSSGLLSGKLSFSPPRPQGHASARHDSRDVQSYQCIGNIHALASIIRCSGEARVAESPITYMSFARSFRVSWNHNVGLHSDRVLLRALSSYTDSEGEEYTGSSQAGVHASQKAEDSLSRSDGSALSDRMRGMADAFGISSRTAFSITTLISLAALVMPLFMHSLGAGMPFKTKALSYVTLLFGFYMAWNIGANDVANAMGTSVGSGALTLRQAVMAAAVLEFGGAFLIGSHVSHTMQKGILMASVFEGRSSLLFTGMLSSLAAAGTWLQVASYYGWPVSTTHCIIGAMVGFGLVFGGVEAVFWKSLARVVSSWVISPFIGAAVAFVVYKCIRVFVYSAANPGRAAATAAPILVLLGFTSFTYAAFPLSSSPFLAMVEALGCGIVAAVSVNIIIQRQLGKLLKDSTACSSPMPSEGGRPRLLGFNLMSNVEGPRGANLTIVYSVFGYLQVLSACFMSFAHGANDVANAIGPISAALAILQGVGLSGDVAMPVDVLAWGGFGIVAGLLVWGYRVIATIGKKITELTPTRGFAAEFAAATVVILASRLGLPISATHTLVGAVMGVGFARGLNSVRVDTVKEIVASWIVTIPVGALLSVIYTAILSFLIPSIT
ncbi:hypothetical protein GOP47_0006931 [Adiantum capillus-veneris]|uniref:Phosphate transporter n=1 Tax=Adiantum capillus-veneris TaxID=13818 RepID=A0A9D4ZKE9_ADICA|nr:hypothetical protein GOP47_0006931 [Adiantum capillus-veneris]